MQPGDKVVFLKNDYGEKNYVYTKDNRAISIQPLQFFIKIKDSWIDKLLGRSMYRFEKSDLEVNLKQFENTVWLKKVEE